MVGKEKCPRCGNAMSRMAHGSNQVDVCRKCSYTVNTRTGTVITAPDFKFGQSLFLNCPSCNARLRTKKNNGIQDLDCPYCLHRWRFDTGAPSPDAPTWQTKCPQCGELYHINKNEGARKITCPNCQKIWRFQSDTGEYLPDADVSGSHILVTCPKCRTTNRVPAGKGNLRITCGGCTHKFYLSGDPALAKKQAEPSYSTAVPKASVKSEAHHEEDIPQAGFFTGVKTFFQKSKEAAEDRKSREAAEIRLAENSLLVYLFGTKQIEVLSQQDAYEMFADPTVGGMDIDVQADGFRIRWFTKDWKVIDTTTMTFRHIKDINTDEWGASVIDPLLEHLEFPAARAAMQRVLMTDYIGKIPYLNVNPKIGRVTFNGKPYGAVWEAADKAQSDSSNPSAANKSQPIFLVKNA